MLEKQLTMPLLNTISSVGRQSASMCCSGKRKKGDTREFSFHPVIPWHAPHATIDLDSFLLKFAYDLSSC